MDGSAGDGAGAAEASSEGTGRGDAVEDTVGGRRGSVLELPIGQCTDEKPSLNAPEKF